jgi:hypothetical protein
MRYDRRLFCRMGLLLLLSASVTGLAEQPSQVLAWGDWWSKLFDSPPPVAIRRGGSRGPYLCLIAPSRDQRVWSDRPTLVWRGRVERVELVTSDLEKTLWHQDVTQTNQILAVSGAGAGQEAYWVTAQPEEALQPEQFYYWRLYQQSNPPIEPMAVPFQMLSKAEHERIQELLPVGEEKVLNRADAFAKLELWSDFWHEVLAIEQPMLEVQRMVDQTFSQLCPPPDLPQESDRGR